MFGHDARLRKDGHEVVISVPAWNDMYVDMRFDPGPGDAPEIDPHVEPVRCKRRAQDRQGMPRQICQVMADDGRKILQARNVAVRRDEKMSVGIRINVHHDECALSPVEYVSLSIVRPGLCRYVAENASWRHIRRLNIAHSPGSPDPFHSLCLVVLGSHGRERILAWLFTSSNCDLPFVAARVCEGDVDSCRRKQC